MGVFSSSVKESAHPISNNVVCSVRGNCHGSGEKVVFGDDNHITVVSNGKIGSWADSPRTFKTSTLTVKQSVWPCPPIDSR